MGVCALCGREGENISRALRLCADCILKDEPQARDLAREAHERSRSRFGLPLAPPRDAGGTSCMLCVNVCRIGEGQVGYCGVRQNQAGRLVGGDVAGAAVSWYYDPLPTNCVADWVCPASGPAGYPQFTDTRGPETGYCNLAVFYEACSFDCLFCQNWHYRQQRGLSRSHRAEELAAAVNLRTRCICFFGGDPSCQVEHALAAARLARAECAGRILRICWETNGSVGRPWLKLMAETSLESGGCIKFDLKAWDESLHRALCGTSNRQTLANVEYVAGLAQRRSDPPLLVAATLLVPGYVEASQVEKLAAFIAGVGRDIPYTLLAFHPDCEMMDLEATSRRQAEECLAAAHAAGLTRVRIGNVHLLH